MFTCWAKQILFISLCVVGLVACQKEAPQNATDTRFPLELQWTTGAGGSIQGPPVYAEGLVFIRYQGWLNHYQIQAFETTTGRLRWSLEPDAFPDISGTTWVVTEGKLLLSGGEVYAVSLETGEIIWQTGGIFSGHTRIAVGQGKVFVASRGCLGAFNLSTGVEEWHSCSFPNRLYSVYYNDLSSEVILRGKEYYLIDPQSGRTVRMFDRETLCGFELIRDSKLYCLTYVFDASDGSLIAANNSANREEYWPPHLTEDTFYHRTKSGTVKALDAEDMSLKWEYEPLPHDDGSKPAILSNIAVLDSIGYAIADDATLRAFDITTGKEIGWWQAESVFDWRPPRSAHYYPGVATDGTSIFATFGGTTLYAFRPKVVEGN